MKITERQATTMLAALVDAISDRISYRDAWVPLYCEPDDDARKVIADANLMLARYRQLQTYLQKQLRKVK